MEKNIQCCSAMGSEMPKPNGSSASIWLPRNWVHRGDHTHWTQVAILCPSAGPGRPGYVYDSICCHCLESSDTSDLCSWPKFCCRLWYADTEWQFQINMVAQDPSLSVVYETPRPSSSSVSISGPWRSGPLSLYMSHHHGGPLHTTYFAQHLPANWASLFLSFSLPLTFHFLSFIFSLLYLWPSLSLLLSPPLMLSNLSEILSSWNF